MKIKINSIYGLPLTRHHHNDAGADICSPDTLDIYPYEIKKINSGISIEMPDGFMGLVMPRSSTGSKGLIPVLSPIDSGYRGTFHMIMQNLSNEVIHIEAGDRIAQLVIIPCLCCDFVEDINDYRYNGAFGSTGV